MDILSLTFCQKVLIFLHLSHELGPTSERIGENIWMLKHWVCLLIIKALCSVLSFWCAACSFHFAQHGRKKTYFLASDCVQNMLSEPQSYLQIWICDNRWIQPNQLEEVAPQMQTWFNIGFGRTNIAFISRSSCSQVYPTHKQND